MDILSLVWNEGIIRPFLNALVLLYAYLFHNFGLAVLVFTVLIHFLTLPLTLRQIRQTKAMSDLQPRLQELRKKHGDDRQKISSETMRLYRENGVNPVGCLGPLVIQMPILIGLYWSVMRTLPFSPERLAELGTLLYGSIEIVHRVVPVSGAFLWMDLALPDSVGILAVLVAGSMYIQQKMTMSRSMDPGQARQQRMMLWMMPLFFAVLAFTLPAGLTFYIFVSNVFRIVTQYFVAGWGALSFRRSRPPAPQGVLSGEEKQSDDATRKLRSGSQDGGGGDRDRAKRTRRRPRRGRGGGR